jgi:WD40 repeat protein
VVCSFVLNMLERKKFIKNYLSEFVPNVIVNLINEYDYHLVGKCDSTLENRSSVYHSLFNRVYPTTCISMPDDSSSCCFPERTERLVSGYSDGTLKIWNVQTGKCDLSLKASSEQIETCFILPDGRIGILELALKHIKIWNIQTKTYDIISERVHNWITCCAIMKDGRIVTGCSDCTLKVWNSKTLQIELILKGHTDMITCCAVLPGDYSNCCCFSERSERIVSGSDDGTIKIWNLHSKNNTTMERSDSDVVSDDNPIEITPQNTHLISCESTIICEAAIFSAFYQRGKSINYCSILSNERIIVGLEDDTLKIWNIHTGKCELMIRNDLIKTRSRIVLPDGRICISYDNRFVRYGKIYENSEVGFLKVWNVHEIIYRNIQCFTTEFERYDYETPEEQIGSCNLILKGHSETVMCSTILNDGRLVSGSYDETIKIWS